MGTHITLGIDQYFPQQETFPYIAFERFTLTSDGHFSHMYSENYGPGEKTIMKTAAHMNSNSVEVSDEVMQSMSYFGRVIRPFLETVETPDSPEA